VLTFDGELIHSVWRLGRIGYIRCTAARASGVTSGIESAADNLPASSPPPLTPNRNSTTCLFDHFVGDGEHARRNSEAERLRRLEIDDKLMFGSLLNGEVGWFSAPEDFIDVESKSAGEKLGLALDIVPSATREEFDVALVSMAQEKSRRSSRRAVTAHAYIMCALQQNPSLFDSSHRLLRSVSVGALAVFLRPAPRETRSLRTSVATYKD
jgi:hypothetical protein